jgi:Zn-dependent protease
MPPILIALTFHEYAHGMMAYRLGDPTAKRAGRLTLNPLSHLDLIGTLALLLVHFGWAKPVPVNPAYLNNPRRDMIWISLAGPGANIVLALIVGMAFQFLIKQGIIGYRGIPYLILSFTVFINLMLAFFNLIPLPPLDGSKVVGGLIPMQYIRIWETFERFGGFIIIALFLIGTLTGINVFSPIFKLSAIVYTAFTGEQSLF